LASLIITQPSHKELLLKYKYNPDTYSLVSLMSYIDRMNDGQYICEGNWEYLVPDYAADKVKSVYWDFQHTAIEFYDEDERLVFITFGTGYDDTLTPLAFLVDK
jgi:hypothetical protein